MSAARLLCRPLAALALALPLAAAAEPPLGSTLAGLLAYARERHPELRMSQFEADAASARIVPAGALPDPMFEIELRDFTNYGTDLPASINPANVGSTKYTLAQPLPSWGKRDARRAAAEAGAEEARARVQAAWADLALRIKTAYARYQAADENLVQSRALLDLLNRLDAAAQLRYAGGLAPQQDAIRIQVERTMLSSDVVMLEGELATVRARLNGLLSRPADAPLAAPGEAPLPPLAKLDGKLLLERLMARNPQLQADEARVRAANFNRDAVLANRWPEFTPGFSVVQQNSQIVEYELRLEFNLPLQQSARRGDEAEARAMLDAAQARRDATANDGQAQLAEALAQLQAARRVESMLAGTLLPQADVALQAALVGYENSRVDFATVLEAQRQIRNTRLNLIKTRTEARMRLAEIERLLGEEL